jgi:membrane-associated phospholipid phosphatase
VQRRTLTFVALLSLLSFVLLAADLAQGHGEYGFEDSLLRFLGSPTSLDTWVEAADLLAVPAIMGVLIIAFAFGVWRRSVVRVAVYAGFAAVAFLLSDYVAKPLVHETDKGHLTFPSGNVTAVCATAVAMWLALHPLLGRLSRSVTLLLGAAWVLLISVAVVGAHWHTPFDALGSVLLSLGVIAAGGAVFERVQQRATTGTDVGGASRLATRADPGLQMPQAPQPARPTSGKRPRARAFLPETSSR